MWCFNYLNNNQELTHLPKELKEDNSHFLGNISSRISNNKSTEPPPQSQIQSQLKNNEAEL